MRRGVCVERGRSDSVRHQIGGCPAAHGFQCVTEPCFSPAQLIRKIAMVKNCLTPHFSTSQFTAFVICFSKTYVTCIMCLELFLWNCLYRDFNSLFGGTADSLVCVSLLEVLLHLIAKWMAIKCHLFGICH